MKIYTKTGDAGETGLFAGPRVAKDDPRIEAYGTVDELNALLGSCRSTTPPVEIDSELARIQHELFVVGAELATPDPSKLGMPLIGTTHIIALEQAIDRFETSLASLTRFILPGGTAAAAALHLARTVCRRAERRVISLARTAPSPISPHLVVYLNRLGDLLFVLARSANASSGRSDVPWEQPDGPRA